MKALRALAPWLVGSALLLFVAGRVDLAATADAIGRGQGARFGVWVLAFWALWLAIDSGVLAWLYGRGDHGIGWWPMALERAATYPLMLLSYHLASAALVVRLGRHPTRGVARRAGLQAAHYLCDLLALAGMAALASWWVAVPGGGVLRPALLGILLGTAVVLLAARAGRAWLIGRPGVEVLADLSPATLLGAVFGRLLWYASTIVFVWGTGGMFGLDLSLADVAARMPLVLAATALPITPAGLGTTQAAMLVLFAGLAPEPTILAYALVYSGVLLLMRVPVGALGWLLARPSVARLQEVQA